MKTLMLSTDRKIFEPGSEVKSRMLGYASNLEELFIVVLGLNYPLQVEGRLKYLGLTRWRALWWRPESNFDLVTAQDPFETGFIAWRLARIIKAKLELQIHTDFLSPYFSKQSSLNQIRVWITKFLLPRADKVRVVSQRLADSLTTNHYQLKTAPEVRPIAVDIEKIKTTPITIDLHQKYPQFKKIILMASRLTKEKNISLALEAMRDLDFGLVIVGSGPLELELKLKAKSLNLKAIFEPWVDRATLISYYKTADLFLLTSLYEGYGLTLVEAQAAGCPIISTDVGVAPEVGAIITSNDPVALRELILKTL